MAILILHRDTSLTDAERAALPSGVTVAQSMGDVVARVELNVGTDALLQLAFKLGQAVPGATLELRGIATPTRQPPPSKEAAAPGQPSSAGAADPWELVDAGRFDVAAEHLAGRSLDMAGRDRIRVLFESTDPGKVAFACRAAGLTGWKSFAPSLRRALGHGDVRVRCESATALGFLAGPSLLPALEKLLDDVSPDVRAAAAQAIATIEAR